MQVSVADAETQLADLVTRAEAGEEIVLTRHGRPAVRLTAVTAEDTAARRRAVLEAARLAAPGSVVEGPCAARSQDFLYDEDGLPA